MHCVHLKTSGFLRVLRTRDRIVRSNTWFIHSLLASHFALQILGEMIFQRCDCVCTIPRDTIASERKS